MPDFWGRPMQHEAFERSGVASSPRIFDFDVTAPPQKNLDPIQPAVFGSVGVDMKLPRGATAQNGFTEVLAEDLETLYQCRICEEILREHELDAHQCLNQKIKMKEYYEDE